MSEVRGRGQGVILDVENMYIINIYIKACKQGIAQVIQFEI